MFSVSSSDRNVSSGKTFIYKKYIHVYGLKIVSLPEIIKARKNKKLKNKSFNMKCKKCDFFTFEYKCLRARMRNDKLLSVLDKSIIACW